MPVSAESVVESSDETDLEALLAREVQAARLAASAQLLAIHAPASSYEREALAYLANAYPDTEPGRQAARRFSPVTEQTP